MLIADGKTAALSSSSLQADTINMVAKHAMKKYFFFIVIAILMINNPDFAQQRILIQFRICNRKQVMSR